MTAPGPRPHATRPAPRAAVAVVAGSLALLACVAPPPPAKTPDVVVTTTSTTVTTTTTGRAAFNQPTTTEGRLGQAALTPLGDLNVVKADIPPVLVAARLAPYGRPPVATCEALGAEIARLDAVLGPDLDHAVVAPDGTLLQRGGRTVGHEAMNAVQHTAEGLVPFRGWVRKLSGAERYAADVEAALDAGAVRRAYLKGLGQGAGCAAPAAPAVPVVAVPASAPAPAASQAAGGMPG